MFILKFFNVSGCDTVAIARSRSFCVASESLTYRAAPLLTKASAFLVWWSSATFGEGTSMTGFCSRQNSEIDPAPARLITKSLRCMLLPCLI